jgi:glycosyltransferase involved in cell wall biosynthesis
MNDFKIEILLATYNGERYLSQQIDSLLAQDWHDVSITVSDNDSTDGTWPILNRFALQAPGKFRLLRNTGVRGVVGNFTFLMEQATADYVAFCDQDDLWEVDKLSVLMERMVETEGRHSVNQPVMVYSDMRLIDGSDRVICESLWRKAGVVPRRAGFRNLLAQNLATGCTVLVNRALLRLALPMPQAGCVMMHDYWLSLVAMAFGTCLPVERQTVSYRQHESNVVGAGAKLTPIGRIQRIFSDPDLDVWIRSAARQAECFDTRYGEILKENERKVLSAMKSLPAKHGYGRAWSMMRLGIRRTGTLNHLQFLLRVVFGS